MNLKNYTSEVPAELTISRIEQLLAAAGASGIMKMYGPDKRASAILFHIEITNGRQVTIRVPSNTEACYQSMLRQHVLAHPKMMENTKERLKDQAARTAWRIVQDWIECQISMITMQQIRFEEAFLAHIWDGKQTFFEHVKGGGFKALPAPKE